MVGKRGRLQKNDFTFASLSFHRSRVVFHIFSATRLSGTGTLSKGSRRVVKEKKMKQKTRRGSSRLNGWSLWLAVFRGHLGYRLASF